MKKKPKLYHYVITIQATVPGGGIRIGTFSDLIEPHGDSLEVFKDRLTFACSQLGTRIEASYVMHWTLQPAEQF